MIVTKETTIKNQYVLCVDVGNSEISMALFDKLDIKAECSMSSKTNRSASEIALLVRDSFAMKGVDISQVSVAAISSVCCSASYPLKIAFSNFFNMKIVEMSADYVHNLKFIFNNGRIGCDLIMCASAAVSVFPNEPIIFIAMGTATVLGAITANAEFLSTVIMPGFELSARALSHGTAGLPMIDITKKISETTVDSAERAVLRGLILGHEGAIRAIIENIKKNDLKVNSCKLIACGGCSVFFKDLNMFDFIDKALCLKGIALNAS